jgi:hypothetical protein
VWLYLAPTIGGAALHVPDAGLNTSALAEARCRRCPPATSTFPPGRRVSVWVLRAVAMAPVALHVPDVGL